MSRLLVPSTIVSHLVADARAVAPQEACGLLAGRGDQVLAYHPMTNQDRSAEHFSMDPREQFAAAKAMRDAGHALLAVFHSHPATPARPSAEDIRLALTPGVLHVILSLADPCGPDLRAFAIQDGVTTPVPVEVSPEPQEVTS